MAASENDIVKIRRSWTEERIQLAIGFVIAMIAIFGFHKHTLAVMYVPWTVAFLVMNRRQGIDLTPTEAVVRRPFTPARRVPRDQITDVSIVRVGKAGMVGLFREGSKRPIKLSVMTAFGDKGKDRLERTHRQIRQWWLDGQADAVREPAQIPGSASI